MLMASSCGGLPATKSVRYCGGRAPLPLQRSRKLGVSNEPPKATSISPPLRQSRHGTGHEIEQQLDLVLGHVAGRAAPVQLVLALGDADEAARDLLGGAEVDHGTGGARGAKGKARELQPRRRLFRHIPDDVQGIGLGLGVVILVEDLEAIVNGADGIDDVVANLARDESRQFEVGRIGALVHNMPHEIGLARLRLAQLRLARLKCGGSSATARRELRGPLANT